MKDLRIDLLKCVSSKIFFLRIIRFHHTELFLFHICIYWRWIDHLATHLLQVYSLERACSHTSGILLTSRLLVTSGSILTLPPRILWLTQRSVQSRILLPTLIDHGENNHILSPRSVLVPLNVCRILLQAPAFKKSYWLASPSPCMQ